MSTSTKKRIHKGNRSRRANRVQRVRYDKDKYGGAKGVKGVGDTSGIGAKGVEQNFPSHFHDGKEFKWHNSPFWTATQSYPNGYAYSIRNASGQFVGYLEENEYLKQKAEQAAKKQEPPAEQEQGQKQPNVPGIEETAKEYGDAARAGDEKGKKKAVEKARKQIEESKKPEAGKPDYKTLQDYDKFYGLPSDQRADLLKQAFNDVKKRYESNKSFTEEERKEVEQNLRTAEGHLANPRLLEGYELQNIVRNNILDSLYETRRAEKRTAKTAPANQPKKPVEKPKEKAPEKQDETPRGPYKMDAKSLPWKKDEAGRKRVSNLLIKNPHGIVLSTDENANVQRFRLDKERGIISVKASESYDPDGKYILNTSFRANGKVPWGIAMNRGKWNKQTREWEFPIEKIEGLRGSGSVFPEVGWALDPKMIGAAVKEAQANRKEPEPEPEPPEPPILEEEAEVSPEPPTASQAAAQKPEEPEQAAQNIGNEVQEPVSEKPAAEPPAEEPQEEPTAGPVAAQTEPENDLKPVDKEDLDKRKPLEEWKAAYKEPTFRQANRMVECSSILSKEWGKVYRRVAQLKRANDKAGVRRVLLHAYNRYFRICEEAYTKWGDGEALRLIAGDKLGAMNGDASEVRAFLNNSLNYSYLKASPDQLMAWADTCDVASQKARDYFKDDNRRSLYDENDVEGSEPDPELLEQLQRDKKEQERKRREKEKELQAASEESWEEYEGEDEDENEIPEAVRAVGNAATRDENRALHEESYDENDTMGAAPDGVSDDDAGAEELKRNYPKHPDQIYSERNVDEDWGGSLAQDWGDEDDTEIPDVVSEVGTEAQTGKDVAALKKARNNANFLLQNGLKIGAALNARAAAMEAMFKATPKEAPKAQAEFEKRQKELESLEYEQKKVLSWFASKYGELTGDDKAIVGRYGAGNFKYDNEKILADQIENLYGMYEKALNGEIEKAEEEPETDQNEIPPAVAAVGNEAQTGYEEPYEEVEEESPEEEEPEGAPRSQKSAFDYSFRKRAEAWQGSPKKSIGALNRTYDKIKDEADIQRERETDEKAAKALESIVNDKITADTEFPFKGGVVKPLYIDKSNIGAIVQFSPEALAGLERYLNSESGWNTFYKIPGTEDTFAVQIGKGYQNALQQMLAVPMSLSDIYRRAASKFDKLIDNEGVSLAPSEGPAEENAIQPDLSEDEIPESVAEVGNEAQPEAEQAAVEPSVPEEPAAEQEPEAENEIPAAVAQVGDEAQSGNGSPVGYVPIKSLKLDPKRFQFKHDSQNERGYNEATYRGAKFNPDLAGTILVWRDPEDGQTYIVNGHHRYNLALDNGYTGNLAVRFSPASNAQEAKQQGAIQNIADGKGTGVDVAALLRDGMTKRQMIEAGISPSSTLMNKGAVLSRLTPRLFDELEGGPLDEDTAMIIADTIPEVDKEGNVVNPQDEKQIQFYERYLRKQYENGERPKKDYVEALALSFAMAEGQSRGMNLFGEEDVDYHEEVEARAKILQRILSELRKDERTFGKINKNSSDLFTERKVLDGTLDADAAKGIKETAKRTIATIKSESKYRGPLNDLLKETVREWLDAGTESAKNAVIDEAVSKLKEYAAGLGRFGVFGDSQKEDDGRSGVLEGSSSDGNGELVSGTEPAQGAEEQGRLDYPASGDGGEVPQLEAEADGSGRGLYAGGDTTGDENGSGEGSAGDEGLLSAEEQDVPPEASEVAEEVGASPEEATDIPEAVAETGDEASAEEAPEPEPPTDLLGRRESREEQGDLFDKRGPSLFDEQNISEPTTSEEAAQSVGDDVAQEESASAPEEPENAAEEPEEETPEEAAQEVGEEINDESEEEELSPEEEDKQLHPWKYPDDEFYKTVGPELLSYEVQGYGWANNGDKSGTETLSRILQASPEAVRAYNEAKEADRAYREWLAQDAQTKYGEALDEEFKHSPTYAFLDTQDIIEEVDNSKKRERDAAIKRAQNAIDRIALSAERASNYSYAARKYYDFLDYLKRAKELNVDLISSKDVNELARDIEVSTSAPVEWTENMQHSAYWKRQRRKFNDDILGTYARPDTWSGAEDFTAGDSYYDAEPPQGREAGDELHFYIWADIGGGDKHLYFGADDSAETARKHAFLLGKYVLPSNIQHRSPFEHYKDIEDELKDADSEEKRNEIIERYREEEKKAGSYNKENEKKIRKSLTKFLKERISAIQNGDLSGFRIGTDNGEDEVEDVFLTSKEDPYAAYKDATESLFDVFGKDKVEENHYNLSNISGRDYAVGIALDNLYKEYKLALESGLADSDSDEESPHSAFDAVMEQDRWERYNEALADFRSALEDYRDKQEPKQSPEEAAQTIGNEEQDEPEPTEPPEPEPAPEEGEESAQAVGDEEQAEEAAPEPPVEEEPEQAAQDVGEEQSVSKKPSQVIEEDKELTKRFTEQMKDGSLASQFRELAFDASSGMKSFRQQAPKDPVLQKAFLEFTEKHTPRWNKETYGDDAAALRDIFKRRFDQWYKDRNVIRERRPLPEEEEQKPEPTSEEIAQSVGNEAQEEPTADNTGLAPWEGEDELAKEREAKLDKTPLEDPKQREKVIKKAIRDVGVYDNDPKTRSYYPRFKQMNDLTGDEQVSIKSSPKLQAQIISDALNEYFNTYSGNDRDDDGNEREGFWHVGDVNMGTMRRPRYVSTILIDKSRLDDAIETGLSAILEKNPDYFSNLIANSKKDREEWSAKYEDRVNEVFPGELKGSPKQVDWARKIQKKALSAIDKFVDNGIIEGGVPIQRDFSDKKKNLGLSIDEDKRALLDKFSEALATPEFRRKLAEYVIQEELPKDSARDWIDLETQRDGSHTDLDTGQQYGQTSKWNCTSNVRDRIWRQALRMFTDLVGGYQDTIDRFNQWLNEGDSPVETSAPEPEVSPEDAAQSVGNEVQETEPEKAIPEAETSEEPTDESSPVVGEQNSVVGEPESVVGAVVGEPEEETATADIPEEVASVGDEAQEPIQEAPQEPQGAPAAEEPTIEPESEPEEQEEAYTPQKANKPDGYYQVDEEAARRAKDAISFRGYDKGSATNEYRGMVDEARAIAERQKAKTDPRYHDKIDALLDKYERKLAENINARNVNMARVPSVMVAGPANFPVRRKEKQNQREETLMKEYNEIEGILDRIKGVGTAGISADDENALDKLQGRIDLIKKQHDLSVRINKYLRKNGSIEGFPTADEDEAAMLKELVREYSDMWNRPGFHGIPGYQLSYDLADINRLQARIDAIKKRDAADYGDGWKFEGGTTRANKEENRLQIFFDQKPDAITRDKLKQNGFRWSQRNNAWQRQLTDNAIYDAKSLGYIPKDFRVVDKEAQQRFAASPYSEQFKEALKVKTGKNDPSNVWSGAKFGKRKAFQKTMGSDPVCQQILIAYSETDGGDAPYYMFHRLINLRHKQFIKDPTCIEEQKPLLNERGTKELTMDDFKKLMSFGSKVREEQEQTPETPEQVAQDVGNDVQAQEPTPEPTPEPEAPSTPEDSAQAVGNEVDEEEPVAQEDITREVQLFGDERKRYEELKRKKDIENGIIAPPQESDEDAAQAIGNDVQEEPVPTPQEAPVDPEEQKKRMLKNMLDAGAISQREYEERMGLREPSGPEPSRLTKDFLDELSKTDPADMRIQSAMQKSILEGLFPAPDKANKKSKDYYSDVLPMSESEGKVSVTAMRDAAVRLSHILSEEDGKRYPYTDYYDKFVKAFNKASKNLTPKNVSSVITYYNLLDARFRKDYGEKAAPILDECRNKILSFVRFAEPEPETPEDAAQAVGQEVQAEPEPPKKTRKRTPKTEPEPTPEPEEEKTPLSLKADTIADVFPEKYGAVQDIVNKYKNAIKNGKSQEEALEEYDPKLRSMMEDVFSQFQKRTDYGYREPESKVVTIETPVEDVMRDKDFEKVFKSVVPKEYQKDEFVKEFVAKYLLYKRYADLNENIRALARAKGVQADIPQDPYVIENDSGYSSFSESPEDMCQEIANRLTNWTKFAVNFHEALKNVSYTPKSIDSYVRQFYRLRDKDPRHLTEETHQQLRELVNEVKKKYKKDGLERLVRALGLHPEEKKPTAAGLVKLIEHHLSQTANYRFKFYERQYSRNATESPIRYGRKNPSKWLNGVEYPWSASKNEYGCWRRNSAGQLFFRSYADAARAETKKNGV